MAPTAKFTQMNSTATISLNIQWILNPTFLSTALVTGEKYGKEAKSKNRPNPASFPRAMFIMPTIMINSPNKALMILEVFAFMLSDLKVL